MATPPSQKPIAQSSSSSAAGRFQNKLNGPCAEIIVTPSGTNLGNKDESQKKFQVLFERCGLSSEAARRSYMQARDAILDRFTSSSAIVEPEEQYKTEDGAAIKISIKHQGGKRSLISKSEAYLGNLK